MRVQLASFAMGAVLVTASAAAAAQQSPDQDPVMRWHVTAGANLPAGSSADLLSDGWNFGLGLQLHQPDSPFGLRLDFNYSSNNASNSGWMSIYSASLDVEVRQPGAVYGYLLGGVGIYNVGVRLSEYAGGYVCNAWWSYCYSGNGHAAFAYDSTTRFGWNAGAGMGFRLQNGSVVFVEARYTWVNTSIQPVQYIPVLVGWRY
jgi:opacity protein-like surface antigen